jgi:hypothetical protein
MESDDQNDDSAHGKRNGRRGKKSRTRVSRACDRCRTKKDKVRMMLLDVFGKWSDVSSVTAIDQAAPHV